MSETREDGSRLAESELFRRGDYAIGILGYKPVVSLPASKAKAIAVRTQQLEIMGIILFSLSVVLFFLGQLGLKRTSTVAGVVIGVRTITIVASYTIIAQTIYEPKTTDKTPDFNLSGESFEWFEGIEMYIGIDDSTLNLRFVNNSLYECTVGVKVTSNRGLVHIPQNHVEFELPTEHTHLEVVSPKETIHTTQFSLQLTDSVKESDSDTIVITTYGSRVNTDRGAKEMIEEREVRVPIEIRNRDEIVVESYEYEILSE